MTMSEYIVETGKATKRRRYKDKMKVLLLRESHWAQRKTRAVQPKTNSVITHNPILREKKRTSLSPLSGEGTGGRNRVPISTPYKKKEKKEEAKTKAWRVIPSLKLKRSSDTKSFGLCSSSFQAK
ncbi:hypothetical protein CCACVL1_12569 [Corchorus capsularis]|uniref:Uncharacterized protein n=1 Tax=Corchorus capsularis TaxID=210143 RepID=A0A1R3IF25_COCAP|nr:hypothetical protein CCACVL1_12569 [Corchorus capsularis]